MSAEFAAIAGARICLVTSGPVGSDPRLVKAADALAASGALVHVVALRVSDISEIVERDRAVLAQAAWSYSEVPRALLPVRIAGKFVQAGARALRGLVPRSRHVAVRALHPDIARLAAAVCAVRANLFIAHNLAALPAAWRASRLHAAKLMFDAEDFHSGELLAGPRGLQQRMLVESVERAFIPLCDAVTASSPGIAQAYAKLCGIALPEVVLNVFPLAMAAGPAADASPPPLRSVYWFSQTIGPGRGLETAVDAIALSRTRPLLAMRGTVSSAYRKEIEQRARSGGVAECLQFLAPEPPQEMARLAAQHAIGLSSEPGNTANNDLALGNKVFTYLSAGIPSVLSATSAHAELARELGGAVALYSCDDAQSLASAFDEILENSAHWSQMASTAALQARARFHWEAERGRLLQRVDAVLAGSGT